MFWGVKLLRSKDPFSEVTIAELINKSASWVVALLQSTFCRLDLRWPDPRSFLTWPKETTFSVELRVPWHQIWRHTLVSIYTSHKLLFFSEDDCRCFERVNWTAVSIYWAVQFWYLLVWTVRCFTDLHSPWPSVQFWYLLVWTGRCFTDLHSHDPVKRFQNCRLYLTETR